MNSISQKIKKKDTSRKKSFFKANEIIAKRAEKFLKKGIPVIFDGNFYWKSSIDDLISRLQYPHQVFTLKASVEICIQRDGARKKTHGEAAARVVHKKSISFTYGEIIDTEKKTIAETLKEIRNKLRI